MNKQDKTCLDLRYFIDYFFAPFRFYLPLTFTQSKESPLLTSYIMKNPKKNIATTAMIVGCMVAPEAM